MSFTPKEDLLRVLMDMGISRNAATRALFYTGNHNADLAAAYIFENPDNVNLEAPLAVDEFDADSSEDEVDEADMAEYLDSGDFYKMVFVVNADLKMGVGKIAAQVAHAALGVYRSMMENSHSHGEALLAWEQFGETKIVLRGENTQQLSELAAKAASLSLPHYVVQDAGRTQVAAGSTTVMGVMGKTSVVDQITGQLSLL